jgi:ABC-2 type transport system ATP-binding protein
MTTAVMLHETTKHYSIPGIPSWSHEVLRSGKLDSPAQLQSLAAVDRVSFSIREGEIFGLVGPSGSGKTTLIRLIATLLQPDAGDIRVFGHDTVRQPVKVQRLINRVSVEASFFKQLSPTENLLYGMQTYGLEDTEALWQVVEILTRLGLDKDEIHQPMEALPSGKPQKVVVARALLSRPRLLLLDEPTRGLDMRTRYEVWQIVRELRGLHGITVLLAAQQREEVKGLCDRIATLEGGRMVALETPSAFEQQAGEAYLHTPKMSPIFTGRMSHPLVYEEKISF